MRSRDRVELGRRWLLPLAIALASLPPNAAPLPAQAVAELYVTPDTLLLSAGERRGLTVQAFDDAGNIILAVRYRSADTAIARVAENGTVTGVGGGRTRITVTSGKKTAAVVVVVSGAPGPPPDAGGVKVARLVAEQGTLALLPTERARVEVVAFGEDNAPIASPRLRWRSLRPDVVSVAESTGVISGVATGQAMVEVSAAGAPSVGIAVSVALAPMVFDRTVVALALGAIDTVTATVPVQGNRRIHGDDLLWRVSDPAVAEVSPGGVVRARALGRAELVVGGFLQERRIPIVVHQPVSYFLASPRVSETARISLGASRGFEVAPHAADSSPIPGVPITWSVGDTLIATFDTATRHLTGVGIGRTTLGFSARGFQPRRWTVDVVPGTLGFERSRAVLRPGEEVTFKVGLVDSAGRIIGPAPGVSWTSSEPARATVSAEGTLVALAPGRVTLRASLPGGAAAEAVAFIVGEAVLTSNRGGQLGLYAVSFAGRDTMFPLVVDSSRNLEGSYSPDRTRLAWSSDRAAAGNLDIYVGDADGRNPVRLTSETGADGQPAWTSDGKHIVFVATRNGTGQLRTVPVAGGEARVLTTLQGGAADPAVSPDGTSVAFTTFPAGPDKPSDVATVPFAGGAPMRVTSTRERSESNPIFLASGQLAWVERLRDASEPDIIASRTAGGTPAVLARSGNQIVAAAISRDGRNLGWLVAQSGGRDKKATDYILRLRQLSGGEERFIRFHPGERIASLGF